MDRKSLPPVVDGADLSLPAFMLMPVFAAGLSVAMWLEMPTLSTALRAHAESLEARRAVYGKLAAVVPESPVAQSQCLAPVAPAPVPDSENATNENMAMVGPDDRLAMGIAAPLGGDQDLYVISKVASR